MIIYQMFLRSMTSKGTIAEAETHLKRIAETGFDTVYVCPIFEADDDMDKTHWSKRQVESNLQNPKNPYRIKDYFKIDAEYGTADEVKSFVKTAHRHGLKVLFDLVYYHCGPKAVLSGINPNFIRRLEDGTAYCGEWRFPILNYDCGELREYMYKNMEYLIREFDIDGYRCDVGDMVPLDFWEEGIKRINKIKPELIMINEGANVEFIKSGVFDVNYHLSWGLDTLEQIRDNFTAKIAEADMRGKRLICFENHDTVSDCGINRLDKKHGEKLCNALFAVIFTCGCVPFVYNGNEIADTSRNSIWGNRFYGSGLCVDWSLSDSDVAKKRTELLRKLSEIHNDVEAIISGDLDVICDKSGLISYVKTFGNQKLFVTANLSETAAELETEAEIKNAKELISEDVTCSGKVLNVAGGGYAIYML